MTNYKGVSSVENRKIRSQMNSAVSKMLLALLAINSNTAFLRKAFGLLFYITLEITIDNFFNIFYNSLIVQTRPYLVSIRVSVFSFYTCTCI